MIRIPGIGGQLFRVAIGTDNILLLAFRAYASAKLLACAYEAYGYGLLGLYRSIFYYVLEIETIRMRWSA